MMGKLFFTWFFLWVKRVPSIDIGACEPIAQLTLFLKLLSHAVRGLNCNCKVLQHT